MSLSYQKRCLERDQEQRVNARLRLNILILAKELLRFGQDGWGPRLKHSSRDNAFRLAREVTGMPEPKKGTQMRLKLHRRRAA